MFERWRRYGEDADARVRARVQRAAGQLRGGYGARCGRWSDIFRDTNPAVSARIGTLRRAIHRELGWRSRLAAALGGPFVYWSSRRDAARYPAGRPLEPRTFVDRPRELTGAARRPASGSAQPQASPALRRSA